MSTTSSTSGQGEVALDQGGEIVVDEDALSPRFRAEIEAVLAPLAVVVVFAAFVARFRRAGQVSRAA